MQETLQQRENTMRAVLHKIQNEVDFKDFSFDEQRIAKECIDEDFIEGIVTAVMASGRVTAEYRFKPRLTYKGMQFLYPPEPEESTKVEVSLSDMEHQRQAEKERNDRAEKETDRITEHKFQLFSAIVGAVTGLLLTLFVEHFSQIMSFIAKLLNQ